MRRAAAILLTMTAACAQQPAERAQIPAAAPPAQPRTAPKAADHWTPPPPPPRPQPGGTPPLAGPTYYEQRYGVSRAEGERRLAHQEHVSALNQWLRTAGPSGFSDIWIEHEPGYAVVIAFKGKPDAPAVLARAHPSLRGDIRFVAARRTRAEVARDEDRVLAVLQRIRTGWAGGYNVRTQKFEYQFSGPEAVAAARRLVPADLRADVVLEVGPVPVPLGR